MFFAFCKIPGLSGAVWGAGGAGGFCFGAELQLPVATIRFLAIVLSLA
jgi:hypothetical protein